MRRRDTPAPSPTVSAPAPTGPWSSRRAPRGRDRKSTRLNSSHSQISYAVFCLKKKATITHYAMDHMARANVAHYHRLSAYVRHFPEDDLPVPDPGSLRLAARESGGYFCEHCG